MAFFWLPLKTWKGYPKTNQTLSITQPRTKTTEHHGTPNRVLKRTKCFDPICKCQGGTSRNNHSPRAKKGNPRSEFQPTTKTRGSHKRASKAQMVLTRQILTRMGMSQMNFALVPWMSRENKPIKGTERAFARFKGQRTC